jgi:NADPH2:quinone reductase
MGSNGYLNEVMKFVQTGQIKPVVHKVFPFEQVQDAHRAMINRENFGKIVLTW